MPRYLLHIFILIVALIPNVLLASPPDNRASMEIDMTHRMMMLAIQLGILLIAARIGGILAKKKNMPDVLGELMAGIIVGPYLLGGIALPGFQEGLFPLFSQTFAVSPELYGICTMASIVLLFSIGLETDARLLLRYSGPGLAIGLGGVIVSFLVTNFAATQLLHYVVPGSYNMLSPACLFLGIIASATSVGITARVLSDQHKLDTPEGLTILAGAVIDDVLGIILLAVGMGIMAASTADNEAIQWGSIGLIAVKAIGIWLGATIIGMLAARRISGLLKNTRDETTIAILALGMALLLAGFFEEARLAMIIGAYVMGLSLSRTDISLVVQDFLHPIHRLLVPVFFAVMGMLVDIRMIFDLKILLATCCFFVIANSVKVVGCGTPALLFGFNMRGAIRIGVGMAPRGEVALIMAGIALSSGLLPHEAFSISILATLLTTIAVPPLLTSLFKNNASGRKRPDSPTQTTSLVFTFPSPDTAELLTSKLRVAFESEGFFVHLIDHNTQLYRVLKDDIAIRFQCTADKIYFTCDAEQQAFISTAMLEVLAEFEHTVEELRKPIDAAAFLTTGERNTPVATQGAQLASALRAERCIPHVTATTKEQVIQELLDIMQTTGTIDDPKLAYADVLQREKMMSTGMQDGVAIPHARTKAVRHLTCAIGMKPEGLDFEALDGQPSKIFVLTLSPADGGTPHIQFMAGISRFLADEEKRALLLEQKTGADMLLALQGKSRSDQLEQTHDSKASWLNKTFRKKRNRTDQVLKEYIKPNLVFHNLQGNHTSDVLRELLAPLSHAGQINNVESILERLLKREEEMPTTMEHGIAVPHLRTNAVNEFLCVIGIHKEGIVFDANEKDLSRIFILTLSPKSKAAPHIQFMAAITHRLDDTVRAKCLQARSDNDLYDILLG